jgi:hypothetical protein
MSRNRKLGSGTAAEGVMEKVPVPNVLPFAPVKAQLFGSATILRTSPVSLLVPL